MHAYESAKLAKEELPTSAITNVIVAKILPLRKNSAGIAHGQTYSPFLSLARVSHQKLLVRNHEQTNRQTSWYPWTAGAGIRRTKDNLAAI